MPNDPFIDSAALSSLGPVRYLDARDQAAFDAGHAPNAVRAPVDAWDKAIKTADIGFGQTAFWEEALGSLGVGPGVTAVTYDAGGMTNAARVWFVLQFFGIPCLIVNGRHYVATSTTSIFAVQTMSYTIMVYIIPGEAGNGRTACHQCIKQQAGGTGWNSEPT
jgi:rhodanese-related sulfurtransferase